MLHIVLFQPEIPPNTGNIIRLCANTGAELHLIRPLGFRLDDNRLRRAGLDYHEWANVRIHDHFEQFLELDEIDRIFAFSTKGTTHFHDINYQTGDTFLFGPETRGLPPEVREHPRINSVTRLPMKPDSRSLNLSNTVAIALYEGWRQLGFNDSI